MDIAKACDLAEGARQQLQQLREDPNSVLVESDLFDDVVWDNTRRSNGKEDEWKRGTFYMVIDQMLSSLDDRFEQNKEIFRCLSYFKPSMFESIRNFKQREFENLVKAIEPFCELYQINSDDCAKELRSFAHCYPKFTNLPDSIANNIEHISMEDKSLSEFSEHSDSEVEDEDDDVSDDNDECKIDNSFVSLLHILEHKDFVLRDAFLILCKVVSIAAAIPISSCSAERAFSVLKRVKTRLRYSMLQDRLEALLLIATEKNIVKFLNRDQIIYAYGRSSAELSRYLIP